MAGPLFFFARDDDPISDSPLKLLPITADNPQGLLRIRGLSIFYQESCRCVRLR
jgi:hypothetical protein